MTCGNLKATTAGKYVRRRALATSLLDMRPEVWIPVRTSTPTRRVQRETHFSASASAPAPLASVLRVSASMTAHDFLKAKDGFSAWKISTRRHLGTAPDGENCKQREHRGCRAEKRMVLVEPRSSDEACLSLSISPCRLVMWTYQVW